MKNESQAITKCQKKAWAEIKNIQNAGNMLVVEQSISDAIEKTFGMWNKGMYLIGMKRLGEMSLLEGERVIRIRRVNYNRYLYVVRNYLIDMIPTRFNHTTMYKKLIGQY